MSVLSKGTTFATGDQVTATNLNNHVDNATFAAGAVDNSTTQLSGGAIIVKDGGITSAKLATNIAVVGTFSAGGNATFSGTVAVTGQISKTNSGTSDNVAFVSSGGTTGACAIALSNTGGTYYLGADNSTGSYLGGGNAYDFAIQVPASRGFSIDVNGTGVVGRFSATGLDVIGESRCDTLRIDTAPTSSVATASTHKVAVNLNGSTYYLLCTT